MSFSCLILLSTGVCHLSWQLCFPILFSMTFLLWKILWWNWFIFFPTHYFMYLCICMFLCLYIYVSRHVKVKGQFGEVSSLLPPCGFQDWTTRDSRFGGKCLCFLSHLNGSPTILNFRSYKPRESLEKCKKYYPLVKKPWLEV